MDKNLPEKYNDAIFSKLIRKIKDFFRNNKVESKSNFKIIDEDKEVHKNETNNILEDIKVNILNSTNEYEKIEFMKNLTNNSELLEKFSVDRLEKILQYYLEENERKRMLLKKINQ